MSNFLLSFSNLISFRIRHFFPLVFFSNLYICCLSSNFADKYQQKTCFIKISQNTVTSILMFSIFLNFNKRRSFPRLILLCVNCNLYRIIIVFYRTCFVGCVWLVGGGGLWLQSLDGEGLIWRGTVNVFDGR